MPGKQHRLRVRNQPERNLLVQIRMSYFFLFAFLPSRQDFFARLIIHDHRIVFFGHETFTRNLPAIDAGDVLVIHDAGAHGFAMGFNYNGKLRSAELLLKPSGQVELIRRAETIDDYLATLDI